MSGTKYLADTNALIYLLEGRDCMKPYLSEKLSASIISEMEMLSYSGITTDEEKEIRSLLLDCDILSLDESIKERTIFIRRQYRVKLPDAIVAATAIDNDLKLITADKGFEKIEELDLSLISV